MQLTSSGQGDSLLKRATDAARTTASSADARAQAGPPPSEVTTGTLGVVFVHGIGSQRRGQTLLDWSGPIIRAVSSWARTAPGVIREGEVDRVVRSEIDFAGDTMPFVTVDVPGVVPMGDQPGFDRQTWVMTEAWWAEQVSPPPLGTMIDWCGREGVVARVVERLIAHLSGGNSGSLVTALSKIGFGLFLSTACTIALLLYAVARAIAAVIPIPPIRDALTRFQLDTFLTKWWGSVYLLLDDPVQSANIRGRLIQAIAGLRAFGCDRIVVVAHSGGTIVSYMALSDPAYDVRADTLITHGEVISMGRFFGGEPRLDGRALRLGAGGRPARWADFWATHDPAPCGTLEPEFSQCSEGVLDDPGWPGTEPYRCASVWNRRSVLDDHGTYFSNDEEFVYPVLAQLDVAGTPATTSRFRPSVPERGGSWVDRRWQRVVMLTLWVRMLFVIPVLAAVGEFVLPGPSMIDKLRDLAYGVLGVIPGVPDLASAIGGFRLPSPFGELVEVIGLLAIITFLVAAFIHAALPIGKAGVWPAGSWSRRVVLALDWAPLFVVALLLIAAIPAFIGWFGGHDFDARLVAVVIVAVAVVVALAAAIASPALPIGDMQRLAADNAPVTAAALLLLVIGILLSIVYALIADDSLRTWVIGTVTAFVLFQALGTVGRWRWTVWDEREREAFRERRPEPLGRGWPAVQIALLGAVAALAGVTILVDWSAGVYVTLGVLVTLVFVAVLRDAALRASPVTPAVQRETASRA